jgi:16S rRNA processing protein RimM
MNASDKILVGKIVAAQGLRGEVRVQSYTEKPEDFRNLRFTDRNLQFVRAVPHSNVVIMKADGADDRTAAEKLRGTGIFIERSTLPDLPEGEYYQADLLGMSINGKDRKVVAIHNFGAADILELDNGEMVSFAGAKVDLESGIITLGE